MDESTKKTEETQLAKVIRDGAIAASIWRRKASRGGVYFDFSLSRSWKSQDGSEGYSHNFFASNEYQLIAVISKATDWISQQRVGDGSETAISEVRTNEAA